MFSCKQVMQAVDGRSLGTAVLLGLLTAACSNSKGKAVSAAGAATPGDGSMTSVAPLLPVVAAPTGVEPLLDQNESIYEEIVEDIQAMGALDANGHLDQQALATWASQAGGLTQEQKKFLFDMGDEMTEFQYTINDGVGSLLGVGPTPAAISRFNRAPNGGRFTGPNARGCSDCHDAPQGNAAGDNVNNVLQDPEPAVAGPFNLRNTRNINGDAWLELAAIEMTVELQSLREQCKAGAAGGQAQTVPLTTKGVDFGAISCLQAAGEVRVNYTRIDGISPDLVVRAQGWKGNVPSFRAFGEDAAFGEMGMMSDRFAYVVQGVPLPAEDLGTLDVPDVDGDQVSHELSVGDVTAIQFYFASQSRPTTLQQLASETPSLLTRRLTDAENALINRGDGQFNALGCNACHTRSLPVNDPVFRIPDERVPAFRDVELEATRNGYSSSAQIRLDLAADAVVEAPRLQARDGAYPVRAMTDLKRHYLGDHLCDGPKLSTPVDSSFRPVAVPADSTTPNLVIKIDSCVFLTADLWGVGQTAPYLHDGRAATLREAIQAHCSATGPVGQANASCDAFNAATDDAQSSLVAFLMNQVFRPDPPEEPEPASL